jgi:hypothetical protein
MFKKRFFDFSQNLNDIKNILHPYLEYQFGSSTREYAVKPIPAEV